MNFAQFSVCCKLFSSVFLMALVLACQASGINSSPPINLPHAVSNIQIVAGTYNQKGSEGIYSFNYDVNNAKFSSPSLLAKAQNPSFIHIESDKMYSVNELGSGQVTTYTKGSGSLQKQSSVGTLGASPCYVSISPDKKFIATANYMGGSVSILGLDKEGLPKEGAQVLQHVGKGANKSRQEAAHAHWVQWTPDQSKLYAVDLGIDEIKVYPFNSLRAKAGKGKTALKLSPGDGPRHMVFHPSSPIVYVLNELSNSVTVAKELEDGVLMSIQTIDTLPRHFNEHSQGGHISISQNAKTLYVSNRGHNSIAVFKIAQNGMLSLIQTEPTNGHWPRHFLLLEDVNVMLVANQESNNIVAMNVHPNGTLSAIGAELVLPQVTFLGRW